MEECIRGRPLTFLELRSPFVQEKMMQVLCRFNYDRNLLKLMRTIKKPDSYQALDFATD